MVSLIAPDFQVAVTEHTTGQSFTDYPISGTGATLAEVMAGTSTMMTTTPARTTAR
jgi:hypothetical protein